MENQDTPQFQPDPTNSELTLEEQKLLLEIDQLRLPWWKKPAYMAAVLPAAIGVFSLIYALSSGFFNRTYAKFEIEQKLYEYNKRQFDDEVDSAHRVQDSLRKLWKSENDSLIKKYIKSQQNLRSLGKENEKLYAGLDTSKKEVRLLISQNRNIEHQNSRLSSLLSYEKNRNEQLAKAQSEKDAQISSLGTELRSVMTELSKCRAKSISEKKVKYDHHKIVKDYTLKAIYERKTWGGESKGLAPTIHLYRNDPKVWRGYSPNFKAIELFRNAKYISYSCVDHKHEHVTTRTSELDEFECKEFAKTTIVVETRVMGDPIFEEY